MHVSCSKLSGFVYYERLYKLLWLTAKLRKSLLNISEHIAGHCGSELWFARLGGRKSRLVPKFGQKVVQGLK